jgi:hypothetical protein
LIPGRNGKPVKAAAGEATDATIDRLAAPCPKEAQAGLDAGIAGGEELADAGRISGTGFAPFRGGPLPAPGFPPSRGQVSPHSRLTAAHSRHIISP